MNSILQSTLKTLQKSKLLLSNLDDATLTNKSISPYYSSIGGHIRHILDFYDCILMSKDGEKVDLTARKRNENIETCCKQASDYLEQIIVKLLATDRNLEDQVTVYDDLGVGVIEMPYTYAALFAQANSHTIHHYAIISYILDRLNIVINDTDFGYNPTTPKAPNLN
ncbi:DinB family protein [Aestuariivivens sp. NBU2969]|uniref:DinB family protein n=1 Tax=Aestuariivivens sp. NBU2969 TaxID=2873267 RepID=UPI001CBAFF33|nr:DinB family protein [Aestuariivivens sp. NBU2969]